MQYFDEQRIFDLINYFWSRENLFIFVSNQYTVQPAFNWLP